MAQMDLKDPINSTEEERWEIVEEGLRTGRIAELCRRRGLAPYLWYRWMEEAEQAAKAALADRIAAGQAVASQQQEKPPVAVPAAGSSRPMTRYRFAVIQGYRTKLPS